MPERTLSPAVQDLILRFLVIADELEPLTVLDADEKSPEWWIRVEEVTGRMSAAARLVARAIAADAHRG